MSTAVEKETGMLDVGTHCDFCKQLDFLPFHCTYCNGDFCANHRIKEGHHCSWLLKNEQEKKKELEQIRDGGGKYFQSLLPEKGYVRVQNKPSGMEIKGPSNNKTNLRSTANKSALEKLACFFKRRDFSTGDSIKKTKSKTSNKSIQLMSLKRTAKGDNSIPLDNRIYLYCYTIDNAQNNDGDDLIEHELYVNKVWPVGRALDYITKQLNIPNHNGNHKISADQKLSLYRKDNQNDKMICLPSSNRVATDVKSLDTLYLVRGSTGIEHCTS